MSNTTRTDAQILEKIKSDIAYYGPQSLRAIEERCYDGNRDTIAQVRRIIQSMIASGELTSHMTGNLWRVGRKARS